MNDFNIHLISDSLGETGSMVIKAALSQFDTEKYTIKRFSFIQEEAELENLLKEISIEENTVIVYTLVDNRLIRLIEKYVSITGIEAVDLLYPLINSISRVSKLKPTGEPGSLRRLDETYFKRVAAIEFAVKYDDGKDPRGFEKADLVLIGVSRTSKTPLSMYMANKNIKVANIPLVVEFDPPEELFKISPKKVVGLTNTPDKLNEIRLERLKALGLSSGSNYASIERILEELEFADRIMKRIGCPIVDVSNKAIEETSEIVINLLKKNGIILR